MLYRFQNLQTAQQLVVLSAILDPLGFAIGYFAGPSAGLDPIMGAVAGVVVSSMIVSVWFTAGRT